MIRAVVTTEVLWYTVLAFVFVSIVGTFAALALDAVVRRFRATFPPHSDYTGIGDKGRGWRS